MYKGFTCDTVEEGSFYGGYVGDLRKGGVSLDQREAIFTKEMPSVKKAMDAFFKAQETTTNTFSAGTLPVLIPVYVLPEIVDLVRRETPLLELLPKRAVRGNSIDYNQITDQGAADFLAEDATLADQDDTYTRQSVQVKYCYSVGRVTGPLQAATTSSGYLNAMQNEIMRKSISLAMELERVIINGDDSTDPKEFDGLIQTITSNTLNKSGANITLDNMRTLIRYCLYAGSTPSTTLSGAQPNLMVTDFATLDTIKGLIQDYLRYPAPGIEIAFGLRAVEFEGVPILASRYMPTTGSSKRLLVLNTQYLFVGVLQDMTFQELAKTNDSSKFTIKWYGALVNQAEQFMAQAYGIL